MLRLFALLAWVGPLAFACDCVTVPAREAKRISAIVFRGTVTGFQGTGFDRLVIFRVSRVWKGNIGASFAMLGVEGDSCLSFPPGLLQIGTEFIVYGQKPDPSRNEYVPLACNTLPVRNTKDLASLGPGKPPR